MCGLHVYVHVHARTGSGTDASPSSPLRLERANGGRGAPSAKPRPISPDLEVGVGLARLGLARVTGVCLYVYVICVVCTHAIYLTPETTYVRALLASKIWRSATRYLACHSATCVDARARELKAFVHSTINA